MQSTSRRELAIVGALLLLALGLRVAVLVVQFDRLAEDRDGYREIGTQLATGHGYSRSLTPGSSPVPTAYRPPVYPVTLAAIFSVGAGDAGIAVLHVLVGTLTVLLTYLMGRRLELGWAAYFAAGMVASDPLLLQYTTLTMTEVYCTFLVTALLWLLVDQAERMQQGRSTVVMRMLIGALFGVCLLCRPTIGAFGLLGVGYAAIVWFRTRSPRSLHLWGLLHLWPACLAAAVVMSPWIIRNQLVIGRATPATTHGGYTLLLGNNPLFYDEVVAKPWGTVWDDAADDRTQAAWLRGVEADLHADLGERAEDEPGRDVWMYRRAWKNISDEPGLFLGACVLRFVRFWNIVPLSPARGSVPAAAVAVVGLFYLLELLAFVWGLIVVLRSRQPGWVAPVLVIAAFCLVHLFFWSNMRMRSPVIPAISLIAAAGLQSVFARVRSKRA